MAEVESVRLETKKSYDSMKAAGLSTNRIMDCILKGKIGHQFHAAKMVIVFERSRERAVEFRSLFPELVDLVAGDTMRKSDENKILKAAGYTKIEGKNELKRRKAKMGQSPSDDEDDTRGMLSIDKKDEKNSIPCETQTVHSEGELQPSLKRKHPDSLSPHCKRARH